MDTYVVYMHKFPNKKVYIGITYQQVEQRWQNGRGYKTQSVYRAIKKYGWANIEHKTLFKELTKEQAEQKERELILLYKSNNKKFGYNIANGGNYAGRTAESTKQKLSNIHKGRTLSEETKEKIRQINIGKHLSEETKEKLRQKNIGKKLSEEHKRKIAIANTGKKHSDATREKLRIANLLENLPPDVLQKRREAQKKRTYRDSPETRKIKSEKMRCRNGQKILCVELNKTFDSVGEAARQLSLHRPSISRVCNGGRKTYNGYHFIKLN